MSLINGHISAGVYTVKNVDSTGAGNWKWKNNTEEKVFCSQGAGSSGGIAESCTGKEITGFREGKHGTGSSRADRDQSKLLL